MEDVEDIIVSSGPNAWPNWRNFSDRIIRPGELVIIDLAALTWNGFKSCVYRTYCVGGQPTAEMKRYYDIAHNWLWDAIEVVRPGVTTRDIASKWPSAKEAWGYEEEDQAAANLWGHGLGLAQYDRPVISRIWSLDYPEEIRPGMVFALETQHGKVHEFGVRLEEMLLVTSTGTSCCPRTRRTRSSWPDERAVPAPAAARPPRQPRRDCPRNGGQGRAAGRRAGRRVSGPAGLDRAGGGEPPGDPCRGGRAAARRAPPRAGAAASCPPGPELAAELQEAVRLLGGRVIVRSSSPLERDQRWAGAFASVAEVGPPDVATAVRSCWASAFAVDPLGPPGRLRPAAGRAGTGPAPPAGDPARGRRGGLGDTSGLRPAQLGTVDVTVEGVEGHPGALLSGWADRRGRAGPAARPRGHRSSAPGPGPPAGGRLTGLLGRDLVTEVARLAAGIYRILGDTSIEWASAGGGVAAAVPGRRTGLGRPR